MEENDRRKDIHARVNKIVEKNPLEKTFQPIIEEFCYRAIDQYHWTENEINAAFNKFEIVSIIQFLRLEQKNEDNENKIYGQQSSIIMSNNVCNFIFFDIDCLKSILKFDQFEIERFINFCMYELGHCVQFNRRYNYVSNGFQIEYEYTNSKDNTIKGTIVNEYAEVINATRLQKGYIFGRSYYERI